MSAGSTEIFGPQNVAGAAIPTSTSDVPQKGRLIISIVSHGHGALLSALLDDLSGAVGPHDHIVVTLNIPESSDFDKRCWPRVEWIDNAAPKGFGANHNHALLGRACEWFAVVNPDIRLAPDALARLVENAAGDSQAAMLAPLVVDGDGVAQDSARALLTPVDLVVRVYGRLFRRRKPLRSAATHNDWIAGMLLVVRSDVFSALRGFDERFFLYCEDMDFSIRLQLAGHRIHYDQSVTVIHDAQRDSHRNFKHLRWHLASVFRAWSSSAFWRYVLDRPRYRALAVVGSTGEIVLSDTADL